MIIDTIFSNRKKSIEKRAAEEAEIVTAVVTHLDEKISKFDRNAVELENMLEQRERELLAKSRSSASERELVRINDAISRLETQISHNNDKTDDFLRVREILLDLEMYIASLIDYEWYSYVIKVVPEKKLPAMVNNESDIGRVVDMVLAIINKIENKMARSIKDEKELEAAKRKIKERAAIMKANYSGSAASHAVSDRLAELQKKYGEEYTAPVSASESDTSAAREVSDRLAQLQKKYGN